MWLVSCLTWMVCCWTQRIFILRWVGSSGTQLRTKFETWQFATNTNQKNTQLSILLGWVESSFFFTKNENTLLGYTNDTLRIWTHVWLELQIKVNGEKNWWGGTVWTGPTGLWAALPDMHVDNGRWRVHLPIKNKNKPPRLSTGLRYLSKPATL